MTLPNFIALFAVQQDVSDLEAQLSLYGNIDYVIDREADLVEGAELPKEWFTARGVQPEDFYAVLWNGLVTDAQWPQKFNQIGSRGMTLLFDDAEAELARLRKDFPDTKVLHEAIEFPRP
ncbi:hypothetical protein LTR10_023908 [Elasticomyces elasticus]|uniref:EthD domain-containing protein n=1 Tax=Exophiala sideris TaxID=1016849 RepID=A0ABR0IUB4_9EURO|nr:hypothetical protein LTR10_023908 [Elasticomyces elasticus]KAK5020882.1 hypothetical protein LTS07_011384 [Exophiala sideris]KAK5048406.1 hypothetical protein LTR69_011394 [Exophiala sideris]